MRRRLLSLSMMLTLAACSTVPSGPSTLVLPGDRVGPVQFRADDRSCRQGAHAELIAAPHPPLSLEEGQLQFDIHYLQCMYGKGHLIPVAGEMIAGPAPDGSTALPASPPPDKPANSR